ncbi:MAG: hypothetical protein ACI8QC_003072 [Planctomycetota bacterium]
MAHIHISSDRSKAFLEGVPGLELEQVSAELEALGIQYGIDHAAIAAALAAPTSGEAVCIATGDEPVARVAARVQLVVQQDLSSGVLDTESQRIDYRERGGVHSVLKDEAVGDWFPGIEGVPGKGVDGEPIDPPSPSTSDQSCGENVRTEPGAGECLRLLAEIDGVVRMGPSGDVYVTDVLEVDGDVDLACGNIEVSGSVHISGTIRRGFKVCAGQDIDVDAAIEDATVKAGKSLRVAAGILAGDQGLIEAGDDVRVKFTQNASVRAGGNVVLEMDTNSTIEAGGSIIAKDGAGHLRGGIYVASESLVAKELGSSQGVETLVRLGADPQLLRASMRVQKELKVAHARANKLQRQREVQSAKRVGKALTRDQAGGIRLAMKAQRDLHKATAVLEQQQRDLEVAMASVGLPLIRIEKTIHSGVRIQIGDAHLSIDHSRPGGTFRRDPDTGEITQT